MLLPLLLLAANDDQPSDTVGFAARNYTYSLMNRLRAYRHEVKPLLQSLTHVCASVSGMVINEWEKKLKAMPDAFYFGNNVVLYREFVNGGVLMIAECTLFPPQVQHMGRVENVRTILTLVYFARVNSESGLCEVRAIPPNGPLEVEATAIFGNQFLEMIRHMKANQVAVQPTVVEEEKKGWWKKITGK